jgi:hypothetical protein
MPNAKSERRLIENEVVFRQLNEEVKKKVIDTNKLAIEDDQEEHVIKFDEPLLFFCECSDENCTERLVMNLQDYSNIHRKRDNFIVVTGHEFDPIEKIIVKGPGFSVVKKNITPPETVKGLKPTNINNV